MDEAIEYILNSQNILEISLNEVAIFYKNGNSIKRIKILGEKRKKYIKIQSRMIEKMAKLEDKKIVNNLEWNK